MQEGTLSAWHPDSFQPVASASPPAFWQRWLPAGTGRAKAWRCPSCQALQIDRAPNPVADQLRQRKLAQVCRWLIPASFLACLLAWVALVVEATLDAVVLGLLAIALAILTSAVGRQCRYHAVWTFVRIYVYLAISFLLYSGLSALAPAETAAFYGVYVALTGAYVGMAGILSHRAWARPPRFKTHTWVCAGCGYLLYGLTEPRCPECGREFNSWILEASLTPRPPGIARFR